MLTKELSGKTAIRPLRYEDLDQFLRIEEACFPPAERASREKVQYRLRQCPELSSGVFIRKFEHELEGGDDSLPAGESTIEKEILIAHIGATKMRTQIITDEAMEVPSELDKYGRSVDPKDSRGHHEDGRTIGVHSVCVDPEYQGNSIGSIMLRDYIQKMTTAHTADNIAIIVHEKLLPFYEKVGFFDVGFSDVQLAGGGWKNMSIELTEKDEDV